MEQTERNGQHIRNATVLASATALVLVILKVVVGAATGTMTLIASAVDSGLDFLISLFNNYAVRNAQKPEDELFNYGRGKIEGLASVFEGVIIAISGVFIIIGACDKLLDGSVIEQTRPAIIVMIISILLTGLLVFHLNKVARTTGNLVIKTDAVHYKMDLWTNLAILAALFLIAQTGWYWLDGAFSILIALMILKATYGLIKDGILMLMDRALDASLINRIEAIITHDKRVNGFHMLRTRHSAGVNFVDMHLVFDKNISLWNAHLISEQIENHIRELEDQRWVINCHLDPVDDSKKDERQ